MSQLKPCPKCGGRVSRYRVKCGLWQFECGQCESDAFRTGFTNRDSAVMEWNLYVNDRESLLHCNICSRPRIIAEATGGIFIQCGCGEHKTVLKGYEDQLRREANCTVLQRTEKCTHGIAASVSWKKSTGYQLSPGCNNDACSLLVDVDYGRVEPLIVSSHSAHVARREWRLVMGHPVDVLCSNCGGVMRCGREMELGDRWIGCSPCGRSVYAEGRG